MAAKESKITKDVVASDDSRNSHEEEEQEENETKIDLGISLDKLTLGPKKKLLVIPLAGIIVHRGHIRSPATIPKNRRPDFSYEKFLVYKRPFCEGFLKFCFERFEVGLWSSAMELVSLISCIMSNLLTSCNPNTAIFPKKYDIENEDDDFLGPNGELRVFLDGLAEAKDVQTYVKDNPFGMPAITPSHSDWPYYSKIIRFFDKKNITHHKN